VKLLITTRSDENTKNWERLTHPILKDYAKKVKADFLVLDEKYDAKDATGGIGNGVYQFRIFEHYNLHEEYDRILSIDNDLLVNNNCPNIFDIVPYDYVGTIFEDVGSRKAYRHNCMIEAQRQFGYVGWHEGYPNTGFFLTSKCHRDVFEKIDGKYFVDWGTDDVHIGYLIKKYGYNVAKLSYQWNHMTMFSESWNNNADRFKSYIIHYAGGGVFESEKVLNKIEQAERDFFLLYGKKPYGEK
jgi:lipopolysaccharide biosynthesis glycosyltransferase